MSSEALSDKAMGVFAFAAYHQLTSGGIVTEVIGQDGAGHTADNEAVSELEAMGLANRADNRVAFTEAGQARLGKVVAALRDAAKA